MTTGGAMRHVFVSLYFFVLFSGCATFMGPDTYTPYKNKAYAKKENYFKDPHNKAMIEIKSSYDNGIGLSIECHRSVAFLSDIMSNSQSFKAETPYIEIIDFDKPLRIFVDEIMNDPKTHNMYKMIKSGRLTRSMLALSFYTKSPVINIMAQPIYYSGSLEGRIYFNGEEVSSSYTNIEYGVVTLNYIVPLSDIIFDSIVKEGEKHDQKKKEAKPAGK
jgi:uncharacterized protein YceK